MKAITEKFTNKYKDKYPGPKGTDEGSTSKRRTGLNSQTTSNPITSSRVEQVYDRKAGGGPQEGMQLFKSAAALRREHLDRTMSREKERPGGQNSKPSGRASQLVKSTTGRNQDNKNNNGLTGTGDMDTISLRDLERSKKIIELKESEFDEL